MTQEDPGCKHPSDPDPPRGKEGPEPTDRSPGVDQLAAGSQPGPLSGSRRHLAGDAVTRRGQRDGRKTRRPHRGNRRPAAPYARAVFKGCGRHRGGAVRAVDHRKARASPAQAQISAAPESLTRSSDANVAASIVHFKEWFVQRAPYTLMRLAPSRCGSQSQAPRKTMAGYRRYGSRWPMAFSLRRSRLRSGHGSPRTLASRQPAKR